MAAVPWSFATAPNIACRNAPYLMSYVVNPVNEHAKSDKDI